MGNGENKQLAINMVAQIAVLIIQLSISFFLTPFIVRSLGMDAYGFVGLSGNIIGYMQVITVALNSMAGRFITIAYHKGNLRKANQYFSSVFYADCILGIIIFLICLGLVFYLEYVISIPKTLIPDVKCLFILLTFSTVINIIFNVYTVSPFIKNRLETTSIRNLISVLWNLVIILFLFLLFTPRVSYIGIASVLSSVYLVIANILIKRKLTPEFHLSRLDYDWRCIKEILSSGVWNLINRISVMLEKGFDLLLANWFISNLIMGMMSVVSTVTVLIPRVVSMAGSSFAPTITECVAKGDIEGIKRNSFKSIKIMSILVVLPLSVLYVYGDCFFALWLPDQNSNLLYLIAVLSTLDMIFGMPLEICWSIFGATNKVKVPAIVMLIVGVLTFLSLFVSLHILKDTITQMICLASARTFWNIVKNLTFLPLYGAKCLDLTWTYFYRTMVKSVTGIILALLFCQIYRWIMMPETWGTLILSSILVCISALGISSIIILQKEDRMYLAQHLHLIKKLSS